jgi:hypothetical protein
MHFYDECRDMLGQTGVDAAGFADFFLAMAKAGDEQVFPAPPGPADATMFVQNGWRLMRGLEPLHSQSFDIWNELWTGCLAAHDRFLTWKGYRAPGGATFALARRT